MVHYDLDHLTQPEDQCVIGPIQDDEALFLYSIIRGMRLTRVLEIGGLAGYSARNFLAAIGEKGVMYTVDYQQVPVLAPNHRVVLKNALDLTPSDVDNQPVDMVFFDCHDMVQMGVFHRLVTQGIITEHTLLALHDTNLHYPPGGLNQGPLVADRVGDVGYAHQPVEREMVNQFKTLGYDVLSIYTTRAKHHADFPFRHGITVCQRFVPL